MNAPHPNQVRCRIDPMDVPPSKAARRLHLTLPEFEAMLPRLIARGFPAPDPDTGNFGLEAIDRWRQARDRRPQGELTSPLPEANHGRSPSLGEKFHAAQERRRHDSAA